MATETDAPAAGASGDAGLRSWAAAFRDRALAQGITPATYDAAMEGITWLPDVVRRDRNQNEFTKTIWDYLATAVSQDRIRGGQEALEKHAALLARIEAEHGVDREIVVAIWGLESAYGGYRGDTPILSALATLAFEGRRAAFFEAELLAALTILQSGDATPEAMRGSWAGAMGHTQFMPSSFLAHAVDATGDGRRDIWGEDPADALASTAAYLRGFGWTKGQPWGVEIALPEGFDFTQTGERVKKPVDDWQAMGIRAAGGGALPDHGAASVLLPAGHRGAAFLIFGNFRVLERYNTADAYVIAAGHLADRIGGGPALRAGWPVEERALTLDERLDLQSRLTARGFDTQGVDGRIGPNTVAAVRAFQMAQGLVPDGFASLSVLNRLR